jgi:hypothetical protein
MTTKAASKPPPLPEKAPRVDIVAESLPTVNDNDNNNNNNNRAESHDEITHAAQIEADGTLLLLLLFCAKKCLFFPFSQIDFRSAASVAAEERRRSQETVIVVLGFVCFSSTNWRIFVFTDRRPRRKTTHNEQTNKQTNNVDRSSHAVHSLKRSFETRQTMELHLSVARAMSQPTAAPDDDDDDDDDYRSVVKRRQRQRCSAIVVVALWHACGGVCCD